MCIKIPQLSYSVYVDDISNYQFQMAKPHETVRCRGNCQGDNETPWHAQWLAFQVCWVISNDRYKARGDASSRQKKSTAHTKETCRNVQHFKNGHGLLCVANGEVVQLSYVQSGKFVCLVTKTLVEKGKDCIMLRWIQDGFKELDFPVNNPFKIG